ncbi:helix-turn-helix domain-containing protein [Pseudonocardia sp. ICBG1293]|uniref:helix-turn-helix domain-containing protein n=1 Tax=Pseudonocardia sp. ICBG1293 TaxID=2844382 RepID=UPI001CCC284B|nr:helix-turn-helix transcriptional regulator [Pseudonocardia sp. ICBG1293]
MSRAGETRTHGGRRAADAGEELRDSGRRAAEEAWSAQVNALGGFIRAQRQMAKLSLREMAAMTKVSNAYLSQVERGLHQPSLKVLRSIADALHLNTDQMLSRAGWSVGDPEASAEAAPAEEAAPAAGAGVPPPGVEAAIQADGRLSAEQKAALLGVYRSFLNRD